MDLLLNEETHDLVWNNGALTKEFTTQPFTQNVSQRLKIRLLTFRNEWFLDTNYGVPWFQEILGKKPSKSKVDQILQQQILEESGVKEIVSFNSTFQNRQYSLSFSVKVVTGEITSPIIVNPIN